MDKSNTSLELKFSLELKESANIECLPSFINIDILKEKPEKQLNLEESVKKSIFWKMYLKRKSGLEEMNRSVEDLVNECLFWKQQLESLTYQNRLLESEKRSLRDDYEELLEKTKHDMGIILKLKDSKKKLDDETVEYFRTDRELTTMKFINTDLSSDKLLLENKKNKLLDSLKKNTANMRRLNATHKRTQSLFEEEKKRSERNSKRHKVELRRLSETLSTGEDVFKQFKKTLGDCEQPIADLESFLNIGLKDYLGLVSNEDKEKESPDNYSENESKAETEDDTSVSKNETSEADEPVSDDLTPTERKILGEWRKNKIISQLTEKENSHLLKTYDHLHNAMKHLNERYMEMTNRRNLEETELHRNIVKAQDLCNAMMLKKRNFPFPPRDERAELRIRIRTQIDEMEAMRTLLSLCYSYVNVDLQFQMEFANGMKKFYTSLFHQIETETKSTTVTEEETITNTTENESVNSSYTSETV